MTNLTEAQFIFPLATRKAAIEKVFEAVKGEVQIPFPPRESVCSGGMHAISGTMKKGSIMVGSIHLTDHLNIMSCGDITVITEDGVVRLTGFNVLACKAGGRRIGLVHEDTTWTTIFKTDETDQAKVLDSMTSEQEI